MHHKPFKFSLANFATTNVTAVQLFSLFWKAVGCLKKKCFLRVIVATCDGASSNRKCFDMHRYFESNASTTGIIHRVKNEFASTMYIYTSFLTPSSYEDNEKCILQIWVSTWKSIHVE